MKTTDQEETFVLFHASLVGRADIVQNAISSIRSKKKLSDKEISAIISTCRTEDNATPLHVASHCNHVDVIRALLNAGADLTITPICGEWKAKLPYELANHSTQQVYHVHTFEQIAMGNDNALILLIKGGVPVDIVDDSAVADSTLHWAATFGRVNVAGVLLRYGCGVNITNAEGQTPLHLACKGKYYSLIELLLDEGADITITDKYGKLPSDYLQKSLNPKLDLLLDINSINVLNPSMKFRRQFETERQALRALNEAGCSNDTNTIEENGSDNRNSTIVPLEQQQHFDELEVDIATPLLLIFWPPVRTQQRTASAAPLVLSSDKVVSFSITDTLSEAKHSFIIATNASDSSKELLLQDCGSTGLFDLFHSLGFQLQESSISSNSSDDSNTLLEGDIVTPTATIQFNIDQLICPVSNSYELMVNNDEICIVAGDRAGLQYGIYTLIQLIKLHSDISSTDSNSDGRSIITKVTIPAIWIADQPDVAQRAVLWSYRRDVRMAVPLMKAQIELMSRLHLNMLLLVLDTAESRGNMLNRDEGKEEVADCSLHMLGNICKQHCIELVPTFIINSIHDRLLTTQKKSMKSSSHCDDDVCNGIGIARIIALSFVLQPGTIVDDLLLFPSFTKEDVTIAPPRPSSVEAVIAAGRACCYKIIQDAKLAGFRTIILSCSAWVKQHINPKRLAGSLSMSVVERDLEHMYPTSLFTKPLLDSRDFIQSINVYVQKVSETYSSSIATFPAFMERDFAYPALFNKYYTLQFAGFVWNRLAVLSMLGDTTSLLSLGGGVPNFISSSNITKQTDEGRENAKNSNNTSTIVQEHHHLTPTSSSSAFDVTPIHEILHMLLLSANTSVPNSGYDRSYNYNDQIKHGWNGNNNKSNTIIEGASSYRFIVDILTGSFSCRLDIIAETTTSGGIAEKEKLLWSLFTAPHSTEMLKIIPIVNNDSEDLSMMPNKTDAALLLKCYRKILAEAGWKANNLKNQINDSFVAVSNHGSSSINNSGCKYKQYSTTCSLGDNAARLVFEIEEIFSTMHILSVVSKSLVLAYASKEKKRLLFLRAAGGADPSSDSLPSPTVSDNDYSNYYRCRIPYDSEAFDSLPVGTRSDVANSILDALSVNAYLWKLRFANSNLMLFFRQDRGLLLMNSLSPLPQTVGPTDGNDASKYRKLSLQESRVMCHHTVLESNKRFLLHARSPMPAAAVFQMISRMLLLPKSVEEFVLRLFAD